MVSPRLQVGRTIGPYRLEQQLGEGGMGMVFLARTTTGDRVAIKILHQHLYPETVLVDRFRREAEAGVLLQHPAIVRTLGTGETADGFHYFAMEYFRGRTIEEILRRHGAMTELQALAVAYHTATALDHAHRKGIFHRDIKPGNIMINRTGDIQVADFGLAFVLNDAEDVKPGTFMGTPAYCPPEQLRGEEVDGRTDLYALGLTLYEMIAGRAAHRGSSPQEIMQQAIHGTVTPLGDVCEDVDKITVVLVEKLIQHQMEDRPTHAHKVVDILGKLIEKQAAVKPGTPDFEALLRTEAQRVFLGTIEHDTGDPGAFLSTQPSTSPDDTQPPTAVTAVTSPDEAYASVPEASAETPRDEAAETQPEEADPASQTTVPDDAQPQAYGTVLARYQQHAAERRTRNITAAVIAGVIAGAALLFWLTGAARALLSFIGDLFE